LIIQEELERPKLTVDELDRFKRFTVGFWQTDLLPETVSGTLKAKFSTLTALVWTLSVKT